MEPLWVKILCYSLGALLTALFAGIRYMTVQLAKIVPREEISKMIEDGLEVQEVRTHDIDSRLRRMEQKIDNLWELLINGKRN